MVSEPRQAPPHPIWALVVFTLALLAFVAVWDFEMGQSKSHTTDPEANLVGVLGAEGSFWGFHTLGLAMWLLPVYVAWFSVRLLLRQQPGKRIITALAALGSCLCASGLAAMLEVTGIVQMQGGLFEHQLSQGVGGWLGEFLATVLLEPYIGPFGTFLVLIMAFFIGSVLVFTDNVGRFFEYLQSLYVRFREWRAAAREARRQRRAERAEAKQKAKEEKRAAKAAKASAAQSGPAQSAAGAAKGTKSAPAAAPAETESAGTEETGAEAAEEGGRKPSLLHGRSFPGPGSRKEKVKLEKKKKGAAGAAKEGGRPVMDEPEPPVDAEAPQPAKSEEPKKAGVDTSGVKIISGEKTEKASVASIPERKGNYVFPPLDLLTLPEETEGDSKEDHAGTMEALVRTLEEFGVKVIPGEIHTGPVITRYEVKPAPGVRVEKIVNLDKNIALGLKAMSVRILAPVPGKGMVGIEVPNKIAQAVCMRDIVESKAWAEAKAEIPIVLGKDVTGKPIVTDLTKMPHVLIAGSTGSGKTVCINAIIASLLYHSGPADLRFIMVDPKVVEMQTYNSLPHMLIPVVTEPKKVPGALKWLIAEMDRRYQIFASENVRNIAGFNAKIAKNKEEQAKAEAMDAEMSAEERAAVNRYEVPRDDDAFEVPKEKMPYIVCIIDELADLMMVAPADIETCIARLAQLARAAGIHLILATQRPSVNVITGVIKANLPSRISFKVASKVDSRTILDGGGAEALIGKGDMLFIPPGSSNMVRAQGAFVSDDEVNSIVEYLKEKNDPPVYAEEVQRQIDEGGDESGGDGGEDDGDELLSEAIDVLRSTKRASTSMLQRRLRVGYNRAARLMEVMEERGIVGPENGSSPREILVDLDSM